MFEELDMPTPCQRCGEIFELYDGTGSLKWFPNTIICQRCGEKEEEEIETDKEILELKAQIEDAYFTINEATTRLKQLGLTIIVKSH